MKKKNFLNEIKNKKIKSKIITFSIIITISFIVTIIIQSIQIKNSRKIYFNKPVSWENVYAYIYDEKENKSLEELNSFQLKQEKDYIYSLEITDEIIDQKKDISDYRIIFFSGEEKKYKIKTRCECHNKIYNIVTGIGEKDTFTRGEWLDYNKNIKIGKIPITSKAINKIIYMIGDGMGENHILAGEIYKGQKLNIQKIENKSFVKSESLETITDSAAGATALATGVKTTNKVIGKDKDGNNVENLIEYANSKGLKTGIVCTQILNHATPAGFVAHNTDRNNYDEIALAEISSCVDLMLGGGRNYFEKYEDKMKENNYKWINSLFEINNIDKNEKLIGTFAEDTISKEKNRTSLSNMTREALTRLDNENGFFLMIEGSDIDYYSHICDIDKMLIEMIDFDDAVGVAKQYVDEHPDTLLIVTADHETGGLVLDGIESKEELTNELFKKRGQHTNTNVVVYAYGKEANKLVQYDIIDNTSICKFVKQGLYNYKK